MRFEHPALSGFNVARFAVLLGTVMVAASGHRDAGDRTTRGFPRVTSIAVTPTVTTIGVGATGAFLAVAHDADGKPVRVASFVWKSSQPTVAIMTRERATVGMARGIGVGVAEITASAGAVTSNSARLVVGEIAGTPQAPEPARPESPPPSRERGGDTSGVTLSCTGKAQKVRAWAGTLRLSYSHTAGGAPKGGSYDSEVIGLQHIASFQIRLDRLALNTAYGVQWEGVVTGGTGSMADAKTLTGPNGSHTSTNHGSTIVGDPQITIASLRIIPLPSCHYTFAVRRLQIMNVHNEDGRDEPPRRVPFFDIWGDAPHPMTGPDGANLLLSGSAPFAAYGNKYPRDADVYVPLSFGSEMFMAGLAAGGDAGTASVSWTFSPVVR